MKQDKPNEWVSIADLMSGVVAVVALLLVVSVIQKTQAELQHKFEQQQAVESRKKAVSDVLSDIQYKVKHSTVDELVYFDFVKERVVLNDGVFDIGSACLTNAITNAIVEFSEEIYGFLEEYPNALVFVEGHTDSSNISVPVTDYKKYCAVYDDNFTLSAARAREVRQLIVKNSSGVNDNRIIVSGFGDLRPLNAENSLDAVNRRIEIRLSLPD